MIYLPVSSNFNFWQSVLIDMKILLLNFVFCHISNHQTGLKVVDGIKVGLSSCIVFVIYSFYLISAFLIVFYFFTVDDARLLLGIYFHGFGNWEKIRLDERLGLTKKIAPVELQHHETFLPRAPNLKDRANALLEQVCNYLNFNFIMPSCFFCIYNLHIY